MSKLADVWVERRDGVAVACVRGQIDLSNRIEVRDRLTAELANVDHGLVLDLVRCDYLDSAGVTALFSIAERLNDRQQQLRLVVPEGARIRRVLDLVDVASVAPVDIEVDAAVAAVRQRALRSP